MGLLWSVAKNSIFGCFEVVDYGAASIVISLSDPRCTSVLRVFKIRFELRRDVQSFLPMSRVFPHEHTYRYTMSLHVPIVCLYLVYFGTIA